MQLLKVAQLDFSDSNLVLVSMNVRLWVVGRDCDITTNFGL